MDLRRYFKQVKEAEAKIDSLYAVITSLATPDGGKAGMQTEVPRTVAAKMVVEGLARLATIEEKQAFEEQRSGEAGQKR